MSQRCHGLFLPVLLLSCFFPCVQATAAEGQGGPPQMPFTFVENTGQTESGVRYIGNGANFRASFRDTEVTFQQGSAVLNLEFLGARRNPRISASNPLGATANYLIGNDSRDWRFGLELFGLLTYSGVWPGIDIRFRAEGGHMKAEYVAGPGGSVDSIRLRFNGRASIQSDGSLIVYTATGQFQEAPPFLCQRDGTEIKGAFKKLKDGTIGVTRHDALPSPVDDPRILLSGYFGGAAESTVTAVAINSYYDIIVAGWTLAGDLPASGNFQPANHGGVDAFVAAFSPSGGTLIYCTYLGGSADDRAFGLAVDSSNNNYITGWTSSPNFPVFKAVQSKLSGTRDAFVTKLNAAGNALVYSTYLGGSGVESGNAIALDSSNSAVIIGDTTSTNLATTAGVFQTRSGGNQDVFVARLSPAGTAVTFMTYFGGSAVDHGAAIKLDSSNSVYIAGSTYSQNLPTAAASQPHSGGGQDGFVAKIAASGASIIFSTYLGGSGGTPGAPEEVNALALDTFGDLFAAGTTSSWNFPVTANTVQTTFAGGQTDGFIARYTTAGALSRCMYFGGSGNDGINGIVADYFGYVYITGYTTSTDFPTRNPIQSAIPGGMSSFVAKLTLGQVFFSTYLGGSGDDSGNAIAIDSLTSIVVGGSSGSWDFPVAGLVGGWQGSAVSSFITKLAPNFTLNVVAAPVFYRDTWHDTGYNGPNLNVTTSSFGLAGDLPVIADWDGSGVKRVGVFRNGEWLLDINGDGVFDAGDKTVQFGQAGDVPIVGDWNGTGSIKLGLFRQGSFILDLSGHLSGVATGLSDAQFAFGLATDIPIVSDWNRTGTSKVGVFRNGLWLVDYNGDRVFNNLDQIWTYGEAGDLPVVGDWSSAGFAEIGVYRNGLWILNYAGNNAFFANGIYELYVAFGGAGYVPLVN